jgi:hypothetical protein
MGVIALLIHSRIHVVSLYRCLQGIYSSHHGIYGMVSLYKCLQGIYSSHHDIYGMNPIRTYFLRIGFRSRLGQRYGLQNTTLTSCFYKKYLWKSDICILLYLQTQQLKSY